MPPGSFRLGLSRALTCAPCARSCPAPRARPERQIAQAGVELIGTTAAAADAEVVLLGAEALEQIGIEDLVIDLNMPTLAPTILKGFGVSDTKPLIAALGR